MREVVARCDGARVVLADAWPRRASSPLFNPDGPWGNQLRNYSRVGFEADLPRIEAADFGGACDRTTGTGCVNPPPGTSFYPIFSTTRKSGECVWQLGGPYIPGTQNTFGGTSAAEYGPPLLSTYASGNSAGFVNRYNNFRQILPRNPCPAD